MKKEELLKKIDEAVIQEEEAVPLYAEHITTLSYWAGLSKESTNEIIKYLKILHKDSLWHAKTFKTIKKMVEKE